MKRNLLFKIYRPKEKKIGKTLTVKKLSLEYMFPGVDGTHGWKVLPLAAKIKKVKIFEGDIISFFDKKSTCNSKTLYVVVWKGDGYIARSHEGDDWGPYTRGIFPITGHDIENVTIKVHGHILTHPELLKSKS